MQTASTLSKLIYDFRNSKYGGLSSDDYNISDRQYIHWINTVRSKLAGEQVSKNNRLPEQMVQDLGCVEIECLDFAVDKCLSDVFPNGSGDKVYRTVKEIPIPISYVLKGENPESVFKFVGKLSGEPISFQSKQEIYWSQFHKPPYNSITRAYWEKNRIYIINGKGLEFINIKGVFENPSAASEFNTCDGKVCFDINDPYPITGRMETMIREIVMNEYVYKTIETGKIQDDINDANTGL